MRKNHLLLESVDVQPFQLPHPGLGGYSEKEMLNLNPEFDDEKKRLTQGDISPLRFSTHQYVQPRYIPCVDEAIQSFEEKIILPLRVRSIDEKNVPDDQFGKPCPECHSIAIVAGDGCAHCIPVVAQTAESNPPLLEVEDEIAEPESRIRKGNRARTKSANLNIGKGGYTRLTSPHLTKKGWKPAAPVVQKKVLGSSEAHWGESKFQKKVEETGFSKMRKNTIAKVTTLEARKSERRGVARIKGKLD